MTEPVGPIHDLDESYVHLSNEVGYAGEQEGTTEMLLLEDNDSEVSRRLLDLLILTCGGAG